MAELAKAAVLPSRLDEVLHKGMYPPLYDRALRPALWFPGYVSTYVERDLRQLINVRDLSTFQRFLCLCAARSGQLLNLSSLANDCGITHNTAKAWISILEASYILFLLRPHHANFKKRLVKTPKLYFHDVGLAAWLLGISDSALLHLHPLRGQLFETWVMGELLKGRYNRGLQSNLFFWRDNTGNEIDVVIDKGLTLDPVEIKSGQTITADFFAGLRKWCALAGKTAGPPTLVYGGDARQEREEITIIPWAQAGGTQAP